MLLNPQLLSLAPCPVMLRLATAISLALFLSVRVEVTQSTPQTNADSLISDPSATTRTDQSGVPGATPTTPSRLSFAPTTPPTKLPWPKKSS